MEERPAIQISSQGEVADPQTTTAATLLQPWAGNPRTYELQADLPLQSSQRGKNKRV